MKRVNIAIVAFGRISKVHLLAIYMANLKMKLPFELHVSHIITSHPEDVPYSGIKVCGSLTEALANDNNIDIVDICNINEAHYKYIKTAIAANKAIYCEKPLTDSISKSKEVYELVEQHNILTAVPLIFRYLPCLHMLKEKLNNEEFGSIIHIEARYYHSGYLAKDKRKTWRTKSSSGGGVSIDLGIHMVDSIRFLLGDLSAVYNHKETYYDEVELDEIYQTCLQDKQGSIINLNTSRIFHQDKQDICIEVFCEKGSYSCDFTNPYVLKQNNFRGNTTYLKPTGKEDFMKYIVEESLATSFHLDAHMCCIADFANHVFKKEIGGYYADFKEAYESQKLLSEGREL